MRNLEADEKYLTHQMDAYKMAHSFPHMREHFDAIKEIREMYRVLELDAKQKKRKTGTLGRRVAHLPPATFIFLSQKAPEILRNTNLLRIFLKNNPEYLVVEKL